MAVATDVLGDAGDLGGFGQARGCQALQQLVDASLVFADQGAFSAALFGAAEDVERAATQALHFGQ